jgi:hypothetical protein
MEIIADRENEQTDEGNLVELEQTSKDFWGRTVGEVTGPFQLNCQTRIRYF